MSREPYTPGDIYRTTCTALLADGTTLGAWRHLIVWDRPTETIPTRILVTWTDGRDEQMPYGEPMWIDVQGTGAWVHGAISGRIEERVGEYKPRSRAENGIPVLAEHYRRQLDAVVEWREQQGADGLSRVRALGQRRAMLSGQVEAVTAELRTAAREAVAGGAQKAATASAAKITRPTLDTWLA